MTTIFGLLGPSLLLLAGPLLAAPAPAASARLIHAAGGVTIGPEEGARPGKSGSPLERGEAVTTAKGAVAVVELPDGSRLKLRESSRVAVTWPGPDSPATEAFLSFGSVFAKVAKRIEGRTFDLRTPSAVAAVRGTEFFTAYGRGKGEARDLWVCVNEGAVEVKTTKDEKGVLIPAGKGVLIKSGLETTEPKPYGWTKGLNWSMDPEKGPLEDKTSLDAAYSDLLDQDYR